MSKLISRGDIVLVQFPFTNLTGSSLRPALVISQRQIGQDVVLIAISSVIRNQIIPTDCIIDTAHPEFKLTGLHVKSAFRVHKLATAERSTITRRIGHIGPLLQNDINRLLSIVLGLP